MILWRKKKVGLVLSSGAARGLAHVGVLSVLESEGIPIDLVTGTSAGCMVGALYAAGRKTAEIKELLLRQTRGTLMRLVDIALPKTGLIKGHRVRDFLANVIGGELNFKDLKMPIACVATDIYSGEEIVINEGLVLDAVRASISIPGIFTVVNREGRYLVDGGLVNPLPVDLARKMGADFVIASSVVPDVTEREHKHGEPKTVVRKEPGVFHVMAQSISIASYSLVQASMKEADVVILPHVAHFGPGEFHRGAELVREGELAAKKAIPEIKQKLKAAYIKLKP